MKSAFRTRVQILASFVLLLLGQRAGYCAETPVLTPRIDGPWWTVAGDPDLGPWTSERQQPVDFCVWQAGDGTWQLWSCIRSTLCGGNTRLFYRWEGRNLTDPDWKPMGIAMTADTELGEALGGLQAPHVITADGVYQMFYGNWHGICRATSRDGKQFQRVLVSDRNTQLFSEDTDEVPANTRDAMVLVIGDTYYCYYTAHPLRQGAVYCRTSQDLKTWSDSKIVARGGQAGSNAYSAECPHVVHRHGWYYLFRTQRYGLNMVSSIYRSQDPLDFGVEDDRCFVGTLPVAAPEIIHYQGNDYLASLLPSLKGIQIARLKWAEQLVYHNLMDFDDPAVRAGWRTVEGKISPLFTTSTRQNFNSRSRHFIGTAESGRDRADDAQVGVLESPAFTIEAEEALLVVSGGKDRRNVYAALLDASTGSEIARFAGSDDNTFRDYPLEKSQYAGRKLRIRVVDRATGGWGHINFGGVFAGTSP